MGKNKNIQTLFIIEFDPEEHRAIKVTEAIPTKPVDFNARDLRQEDVVLLIKSLSQLATGLTNQQFENIAEKIRLDLAVPEDATLN